MIVQPSLSPVPHRDEYCLDEDYTYKFRDIKIVVPGYFCFDGASIPAWAQPLTYTPFHPMVMAAALVHDWLYCSHQVPRETADDIFLEILLRNGADQGKAELMYKAVRVGGGWFWDHDKKDKKNLFLLHILIKNNPNFGEYHFPMEQLK